MNENSFEKFIRKIQVPLILIFQNHGFGSNVAKRIHLYNSGELDRDLSINVELSENGETSRLHNRVPAFFLYCFKLGLMSNYLQVEPVGRWFLSHWDRIHTTRGISTTGMS